MSSLHRSCFPRPSEWPLGKSGASSGERDSCPGEGRGVPVGEEEEVARAGVAVSVGVMAASAGGKMAPAMPASDCVAATA